MVDTVKIHIPVENPAVLDGDAFTPMTLRQLTRCRSGRTYLNPSTVYAKMGVYMPSLTMHKRVTRLGPIYQLVVEFSAPKLLYGNNFEELTDSDFEPLLDLLSERLQTLLRYRFSRQELSSASVAGWHPSKNIIFTDYTSCQTILNTIGKLDISRVYDIQNTNFREGHVLHIHCNSLDIAIYDKIADLRKSRVSQKRAFEDDSRIQVMILDKLRSHQPFEVLRYEVRFNGRQSIKRAYPELTVWTLESMYSQKLCRQILLQHWNKLTASIDMLGLDVNKPYELLQNYLISNPDTTQQSALAAVGGMLINGQEGVSSLRNLIESRYGRNAWYRLKPLFKNPKPNRFMHILHMTNTIEVFSPIRLETCLEDYKNTVN